MPKDQHHKILIVEDDDTNFLYLSIALETENFELIRAFNGNEAIKLIKTHQGSVRLILMDIKLPGIDGFETTRAIRKDFPKIPIIAQTAYYMPNNLSAFEDAKFNDVIFKPFSIDDIIKTIYKNICPTEKTKGNISLFL
ncbi:MAG: response regulator [Bacteroidales bacterium]|nr:response regulator [Bacteroidales bacterium]